MGEISLNISQVTTAAMQYTTIVPEYINVLVLAPVIYGFYQGTKILGGVVGSNPGAIYWMDMTFFRIDLLWGLCCLFQGTENKRK